MEIMSEAKYPPVFGSPWGYLRPQVKCIQHTENLMLSILCRVHIAYENG